jgi:replication factor A1
MAIKDLQARQGNVNLTLDIIEKEAAREFEKFGKKGRVCNCVASDETGKVKLTLWNDDVDKINVGDKIKIDNGWVGEWQGELQLSTGKFGKVEVIGKSDAKPSAQHSEKIHSDKPSSKPAPSKKPKADEEDIIEEEDLESLSDDVVEEEIDFEE